MNLFNLKTTGEWVMEASLTPTPKKIMGDLWYENELNIFFADTNLGKSVLSVQIAESVASGEPILGLENEMEAQKVLYFDFEMTAKQFETRYSQRNEMSQNVNHYPFSNNFIRAEIDPEMNVPTGLTFDVYLRQSFEAVIQQTNIKILIVDNITYLKNEGGGQKTDIELMKTLNILKKKYGLSIMCLAHVPKRNLSKPLTKNDLAGSKMLMNFADSSFTMGGSTQDKYLRYIKQIKTRNSGLKYDTNNVILIEISKPSNFLGFNFVNFDNERKHLRTFNDEERDELIEKVKMMGDDGYTQRDIAEKLKISLGAVNKYLHL